MELQIENENLSEIPVPTQAVLSSIELLNHIKDLFNNDSCIKEQKIQILTHFTLLPKSWSITEIMQHFNVSRYTIEKARNLLYNKGILSIPSPKQGMIK